MALNLKHIDINSLKHYLINLGLSVFGPYGACVALGASVTKEWFDNQSYGHWCWLDLLFDTLGIASGLGIHYIILSII